MRALLVTGLLMLASPVVAQTPYDADMGRIIDRSHCSTAACLSRMEALDRRPPMPPVGPPDFHKVGACVRKEQEFGQYFAKANFLVSSQERLHGGNLTYEQSNDIRSRLYNETYYLRRQLHAAADYGDLQLCNELRDQGIDLIKRVLSGSE